MSYDKQRILLVKLLNINITVGGGGVGEGGSVYRYNWNHRRPTKVSVSPRRDFMNIFFVFFILDFNRKLMH